MRILATISSSSDIGGILNEPNLQGLTPLAVAVLANGEDFVAQLLSHRADMGIPNSDGDTPLHLAVKNRFTQVLRRLLASSRSFEVINRFNYSSESKLAPSRGGPS
jgi:ankyrin repeat protein